MSFISQKSLVWKRFVLHEEKMKFSEEYFFLIFAAILELIYFCNDQLFTTGYLAWNNLPTSSNIILIQKIEKIANQIDQIVPNYPLLRYKSFIFSNSFIRIFHVFYKLIWIWITSSDFYARDIWYISDLISSTIFLTSWISFAFVSISTPNLFSILSL